MATGDENKTVWSTKYALTTGVQKVTAEINDGYAYYGSGRWTRDQLTPGQWHTTKDAALKEAERKRQRKIASTRKLLAKLESMTFTAED